jgi:uncharacterized protein YbcV (DUF1398 family)
MQPSDIEVIAATNRGSFNERMPFPEVVRRLAAIGVERYYADLVRAEKTYYGNNGTSHREPFLGDTPALPAGTFNADAVRAAIRTIQQGEIDYPTFLGRVLAAGCAFYTVHIGGRRAIYTGRDGESYVEMFPAGK